MRWFGVMICLATLACDDGAADTPSDAGPSDGRVQDATADMHPADEGVDTRACDGRFVVTRINAGGGDCLAAPSPGESLVIADGRLQGLGLDLAITDANAECVIEAAGCVAEPEAGNRSAYTARFDPVSGSLTVDVEQAAGFAPVMCAPLMLATRAAEDCTLSGTFTVAAPLELTDGTCDLTWSADTVHIDAESETPSLRWGMSSYAITAIDAAACTLVAESEFLIFNGVARTIRVEARVEGDSVAFTIEDGLDGTSDFGETCVGARFAGDGVRASSEADPLPADCAPLPFVCGDGVCAEDAGESCGNCEADCACADGRCLQYTPQDADTPQFTCSTSCSVDPCAADQRCVPAEEFEAFFTTGQDAVLVCLDAIGDTGLGGDCTDSRTCGAGLMCARNILPGGRCLPDCNTVDQADCRECWPITSNPNRRIVEVCRPRCGPGVESACGESECASFPLNRICSTEDRETYFCQPTELVYECRAEGPAFGEPCAPGQWCGGVGVTPQGPQATGCVEQPCTRGDEGFDCTANLCSRPCETDDDCAAPLPRCSIIETPRGPSKWCRAE